MNENKTLLDLAYEDLEVAKLAFESPKGLLAASIYHIEQAIEKGIKFFAQENGFDYEKTYDLVTLVDIIEQGGVHVPLEKYLYDQLETLESWEIRSRYFTNFDVKPNKVKRLIDEVEVSLGNIKEELDKKYKSQGIEFDNKKQN